MSTTSEELSVREALAFPFRGTEWQGRFVIGAGLLLASFLVPLVPALIVYGYLLRVMRATIEGEPPALPPWTEWGELLRSGFQAFVVGLTYLLPGMAILFLGTGLYCAASLVLPFATAPDGSAGGSADLFAALLLFALVVFFASMAIGSVLSLLGALPLPVAAGNLASSSRLRTAFHLRQLWRVFSANAMGFVTAWVVLFGIWAINYLIMTFAYFTLVLMCLIPVLLIPLGFYSLLVGAALFGDAYRVGRRRLAAAAP